MRLFLLIAAAVIPCGCHTRSASPRPVAARPADDGKITSAELEAHVKFLASDALGGRGTLEPGEEKAAGYIADQFRGYGLEPLPGQTALVVPYRLERLGFSAEGTTLHAGGATSWRAGVDFAPFPFSDNGSVTGPVVFVGYGITAPDQKHDDYAGLDVKGKVVLVLRYAPDWDDDKPGPLGASEHAFLTSKAVNAQKHGAVGMLLVTGPSHARGTDDLRLPERLRLPAPAEGPAAAAPAAPAVPARPPKPEPPSPTFVALHVAPVVAEALLGAPLAAVEKELVAGTRRTLAPAPVTASVSSPAEPELVSARNVLGVIRGSDPALAGEWVVVGAHFDHLGGHLGTGDTIYNGADDNASGTAGLMEMAQAMARGPRPKRSVLFAAFSGEERGLLGSRALLEQGVVDPKQVVFMLNLDMIGRNDGEEIAVIGDGYSTGMGAVVTAANRSVGLPLTLGGDEYSGASDHHPFFMADVPVLFFFTGLHDDYHQLSDHADKLSYARMEKIVTVAAAVVGDVASARHTPHFVHQLTWLGASVEVDAARGAVVTRVDADSRGARAGLAAGDVVVGVDGKELVTPAEIGPRFRAIAPGSKFSLTVARGTARVDVALERAKRGYLGIFPATVDEAQRKKLGLPDDVGVGISGTDPGGPAATAGLREGDVMVELAGLPVGPRTLGQHLARIGAGEKITVVVVREGERLTLPLTLGEAPDRR